MSNTRAGILAMIGACTVWGLSPIYYRQLAHIPPLEVLAHRAFWSLVFFAGLLAVQGRLREVRAAFNGGRRTALIVLAMAFVSVNWFLFIYATMINRNIETSLGYFTYPLVAVVMGYFWFSERLDRMQWIAVGLATVGVLVLSIGLGAPPWISMSLAITFALYGAIKKQLPLGPVVSVTCEVLVVLPLALGYLLWLQTQGIGAFGPSMWDNILLILSGPVTALPLILFSFAARRVDMSTVGVLTYLNPSLQFICAALLFGEVLTLWHQIAFPLIWVALALYSIALWRQSPRSAAIAAGGVSTTVRKSPSDGSAKP
ncbi:MAG: EamA family transporter RarD [Paracoccaceae bacterium]